jgi:hypothetical protein
MPAIVRQASSAASSSNGSGWTEGNNDAYVADHEYPAIDFQGYAEKPLSEQLTPIAVVGMGMLKYLRHKICSMLQYSNCLKQDADFLEMSHLPLNSGR